MKSSTLVHWSGLAAVLAGLVTAAGSFLEAYLDPAYADWGLLIRTATIAIALIGIYLFQRSEAGAWGLLGILLTSVGNLLFLVNFFLGGVLYSLGLVLLAIGSLRARKFSRWVPILWILTILVGFPGFFIESIAAAMFVAGGLILALAFIGAGYTMWTQSSA